MSSSKQEVFFRINFTRQQKKKIEHPAQLSHVSLVETDLIFRVGNNREAETSQAVKCRTYCVKSCSSTNVH